MEHSGVLLLFFDLPNKTVEEKRKYRNFIKFLKKSGFYMLQESVYVMLQRTVKSTPYNLKEIRNNAGKNGNIMVLPMTATQFSKLETICGNPFDVDFLCNDVLVI